ncbi:MAG: M23 family metallopeptidase [Thermomicrobiales bacterium]
MERARLAERMAIWARGIDRRPLLRALAGLGLALAAGHTATPEQADARKREKHRQHRTPDGEAQSCRQRCGKKTGKARRRCHRRCQAGTAPRPCKTDRDCAPCARCLPEGCVSTCQAGEVCQDDRCTAPCPAEGTEVVVTSYAKVKEDFARGSAVAIPAGPDAVANFLNERFTDLQNQFAPELRDMVPPDLWAAYSYIYQHSRVHFELPFINYIFDGYWEGDEIFGFFSYIFHVSFQLTAVDPLPEGTERTLEGRWEGQIFDPTGVLYPTPIALAVTFATVSGELAGTLDFPGYVTDLSLSSVSFTENRPFAQGPLRDTLISPAPRGAAFHALVGWGDVDMHVIWYVDTQGQLVGADFTPDWLLRPDPAASLPPATPIRLPLDGAWLVSSSGPRQWQNHHAGDSTERHAIDFELWNVSGIGPPDTDENADFWAWNQPVFAPVAGTVIHVVDDTPDNQLGTINGVDPANIVGIQVGPHEFLYLAHLRQGSVVVAVGDQVEEGQFLARVGSSGLSSVPHLHIQLQDRIDIYDPEAISIPFRFKDLLVNGNPAANPSLVTGDFVQHDGCPIPVPAEFAPQPGRDRASRSARGGQEQPTMTRRSAEWLRSPAAMPVDGRLLLPGEKR